MASAGSWRALTLALASWLPLVVSAADGQRAAPLRPGAAPAVTTPAVSPRHINAPTKRISGVDYIHLEKAARQLGLRSEERDRGRTLVVLGAGTRADVERDTRDIVINGLRVFLGHPSAVVRGDIYVSRIDFERCLAPLLRPGDGVTVPAMPKLIVLDPGHGGRDFGKINEQLGVNEKTFTLDTARRLKKLLEADGYRVVMTREDDRYLELADRPAVANRANADLFVSLHFNALDRDRKTSGVEVYTFAPQNQRSTDSWMPGKRDDSQPTPEPANEFDYWSSILAQSLHRTFVADLRASDRGKKLMHLGVLRSLRCPGVLMECGFLSSDVEARKIATPAYRQQLAEALRDGLRDYAAVIANARQRAGVSETSRGRRASRSS